MRCKNCGWENPASSVKCEKCGAPLSGDVVSESGNGAGAGGGVGVGARVGAGAGVGEEVGGGARVGAGVGVGATHRVQIERPLKGSVSERDLYGSGAVGGGDAAAGGVCKSCGYPIGRNTSVCPNCGAPVSVAGGQGGYGGDSNKGQTAQSGISHQAMLSPQSENACGTASARGLAPSYGTASSCGTAPSCENVASQKSEVRSETINPYSTPEQGTFCTLKPISWEGEDVDHQAISYSGETIVLNRANTDPNNQSITTKGQAELSFENGAWYIRDKSTKKTTYVHAGRKTKLESGDIIILGNRQFEFKG